ncbi:MAG: hypothetical protein AMS23_06540 [Bacteroides sp. SM1_62]|nr:MAG: hypothetical protein AMS23_06540 [Bacteroides sp. SM1_62]
MKNKHMIKGTTKGRETGGLKATGITEEDIRKRAYGIYLERGLQEGTPEDDWIKSEEELYSDLGF